MKCIIQIPCFNEEKTLPITLKELPRELPNVDELEYLVIDDGSTDRTALVARECGAHHIVGFRGNRGLAQAFSLGVRTCLEKGADIIVNTDADNQYFGPDIKKLVAPVVAGYADIVVGDRDTQSIEHFSKLKKILQRHGSGWVGAFAGIPVPDATSGFRAFSREAVMELNVTSDFSYTLETLIQAGNKRMKVVSVPIKTNSVLRESRLFKSIFSFVRQSATTMIRVYTTHQPLKVFSILSSLFFLGAMGVFARFLYYHFQSGGGGRIQSLLLGLVLFFTGSFLLTVGVLADLINTNRKLIELVLRKQKEGESAEQTENK